MTIEIGIDDLVLLLGHEATDVLHRQRLFIVVVLLARLELVLIELSQVCDGSRIVRIVQYGGIAVQLVFEKIERVGQHFPVVFESSLLYDKLFF